jgi:hypothetical protein
MASETGSSVSPELLKKGIVRRECGTAWLERCNRAASIATTVKALDHRWAGLRSPIRIFESAHLLHVLDHPGRECRHVG